MNMNALNRNALLEERAALLARLADLDRALAVYATLSVRVRTQRNLRNSAGLICGPANAYCVSVYADQACTRYADPADHEGWVSGESAAILVERGQRDVLA